MLLGDRWFGKKKKLKWGYEWKQVSFTSMFFPSLSLPFSKSINISFILSSYSYSSIFLLTFPHFWKELKIFTISTFLSLIYQQSSLPAPHSTKTAISIYFSNLQIVQCIFQSLSS